MKTLRTRKQKLEIKFRKIIPINKKGSRSTSTTRGQDLEPLGRGQFKFRNRKSESMIESVGQKEGSAANAIVPAPQSNNVRIPIFQTLISIEMTI